MTTHRADGKASDGGEGALAPVERCTVHTFELADSLCGECGRPFCHMCIVKPFKRRPPLCHQCAVAAAGVRKGARTAPVRSRKEIKAYERERKQAAARRQPTPAKEQQGAGFGPAKPTFRAAPGRTPAKPAPTRTPDAAKPAEGEGEEATTPGRNRPLRGLAR